MTSAISNTSAVRYLDGVYDLSGDLDTGVSWEYTPNNKTLTFAGAGSIPNFKDGKQPWYATAVQNSGVNTYKFSDEITSIGSGTIGSYGSNSNNAVVYGPVGLNYGSATYMGTVSEGGSGDMDGGTGSNGTITLPKDDDAMIILDAVPTNFMVTVPIAINAFMDSLGNVSTGDGFYVENACAWGPVVIKDVKVVAESEWTLVDFDSDFANMQASTKNMGMTINGVKVAVTGVVTLNDDLSSVIKYQDSKELTFELKLPAQKVALQENIAAIVFTVDFDKV